MSRLIENKLGDYIYISKDIYPITAIYYRDKKVLKTDNVGNYYDYIKNILSIIKNTTNEFNDIFFNYDSHEVVIDNDGIARFSIDNGKVRIYRKDDK